MIGALGTRRRTQMYKEFWWGKPKGEMPLGRSKREWKNNV
jgi:hypothetical protein